jgi:hypothetical protein
LEEVRNSHTVLTVKPELKRLLGISRRRWVSDIKVDLRKMGCDVKIGFNCLRIGSSSGLL